MQLEKEKKACPHCGVVQEVEVEVHLFRNGTIADRYVRSRQCPVCERTFGGFKK